MFHSSFARFFVRPSVVLIAMAAISIAANPTQAHSGNQAVILCKVVMHSGGNIEKIGSIKVEVLDFHGKVLQTATTDVDGKHLFKVTPSALPVWIRATSQGSSNMTQVMVTHFNHQPKLERSFQATLTFPDVVRRENQFVEQDNDRK